MTTKRLALLSSLFWYSRGTKSISTSLVQATYCRLGTKFAKKGEQRICIEILTTSMEGHRAKTNSHNIVHCFIWEHNKFVVGKLCNLQEGRPAGKFRVTLNEMWCDC